MSTQNNTFSEVIADVQNVPPDQRPEHLITGICQQMQASGKSPQQLGTELAQIKPQLVRALQPQQGG
jgi:hypothetical protein